MFVVEDIDFGRRMAIQREINRAENVPPPNAVFDDSGNFLLYPTLLGIKMVNLHTNTVRQPLAASHTKPGDTPAGRHARLCACSHATDVACTPEQCSFMNNRINQCSVTDHCACLHLQPCATVRKCPACWAAVASGD